MAALVSKKGSALVIGLAVVTIGSLFIALIIHRFSRFNRALAQDRASALLSPTVQSVANAVKADLERNYDDFVSGPDWSSCRSATGTAVGDFLNMLSAPPPACGSVLFQWTFIKRPDDISVTNPLQSRVDETLGMVFKPNPATLQTNQYDFDLSLEKINSNRNWIIGHITLKPSTQIPQRTFDLVIDLQRTVSNSLTGTACRHCQSVPGSVCCLEETNFTCENAVLCLDAADTDGDGTPNVGSITGLTLDSWGDRSQNHNDARFMTGAVQSGWGGWKGDGSVGDPYRITFTLSNYIKTPSLGEARSHLFWFRRNAPAPGGPWHTLINCAHRFPNQNTMGMAAFFESSTNFMGLRSGGSSPDLHFYTDTEWHHMGVVVDSDASRTDFYIDGLKMGSLSGGEPTDLHCHLGLSLDLAWPALVGDLAQFMVFRDTLKPQDVLKFYLEDRDRYYANSATPVATRILPASVKTGNPFQINLVGYQLNSISSLSIDGTNGTNYENLADGHLSADFSGTTTDGLKSITVSSTPALANSNLTILSTSVNDGLITHLDARNLDGLGSHPPSTSTKWSNLALGGKAFFVGSGYQWVGTGVASDPYAVEFSNAIAHLGLSGSPTSYMVWFFPPNDNSLQSSLKVIFTCGDGGSHLLVEPLIEYNRPDASQATIHFRYNTVPYLADSVIQTGRWHQLIYTYDTNQPRFYLDGKEVCYSGPYPQQLPKICGVGGLNGYILRGKIAQFRVYQTPLTPAQIQSLYHEGDGLYCTGACADPPNPVCP